MNKFYKGIVTAIIFTAAYSGVQAQENDEFVNEFKRFFPKMIENHVSETRENHTAQIPCNAACKYGKGGLKKDDVMKEALNDIAEIIMQPVEKEASVKGGKKTKGIVQKEEMPKKQQGKTMHDEESLKIVFEKIVEYFSTKEVSIETTEGKIRTKNSYLNKEYPRCFNAIIETAKDVYEIEIAPQTRVKGGMRKKKKTRKEAVSEENQTKINKTKEFLDEIEKQYGPRKNQDSGCTIL